MDNAQINDLLTLIGAVVTLGAAYGKLMGARQTQIVAWVIEGFAVKSKWRGLVNLAVGVALAGALSGFAAWQSGEWGMLVAGLLAGVLASDEAAKTHDEQAAKGTARTDPLARARDYILPGQK